uniref:Kazal-like domain-containing protein n=1 Tax=Gouania willdenowi TaxID=441366 RepID=A0A8C5DYT8_GOUWI
MVKTLIILGSVCSVLFFYLQPSCPTMDDLNACPLNYAPICATDGNTYPNECALCVRRATTKMDILIVKEGNC